MSKEIPLVTLTTDFGTRDPYVAAMKGVIATLCPPAHIVDLSHDIPAQDVYAAAFFLAGAVPYFPPETVHVIVVDPGVGTERLPLAVRAGGQYFICPDNGLLTLVLRASSREAVHTIANPDFMREAISATFHGRDIFAPAAAYLASGASIREIGAPVNDLVELELPEARAAGGKVKGEIVHIDRFGNCITNIHCNVFAGRSPAQVRIGPYVFDTIKETYGAVGKHEPLALFGSSGYLEIAVRNGDASDQLDLKKGYVIEVRL